MARSQWHKLRSYPEESIQPYMDGYMCFIAASSGLSQVILNNNKKIYHQEHSRPPKSFAGYELYKKRIKKMMKLKQPLITNNKNWGLAKESLPDFYI